MSQRRKKLNLCVSDVKITIMTYALETDHCTLETTFNALKTFGFWRPRAAIHSSDYAPIIRRSASPLLSPFELSLLRYGLVPPGFTSPKEADRYGLHTVRAKRITHQREIAKLEGAGQRCLVPMTVRGETRAAAGLWGSWTRKGQTRVESFAVLTLEDGEGVYKPLMLEFGAWQGWLEGIRSLTPLSVFTPPSIVIQQSACVSLMSNRVDVFGTGGDQN